MIVDNMVLGVQGLDGTLITDECEIEVTSMLVTDNGDEMCWWPKSSPTLSHQHHDVTNITVILSNFSDNFPSASKLSNLSQNFRTAAKLSNFS